MNSNTASKKPVPADYVYDRPIIILAAPRSGSTLLFETLTKAPDVWSVGDESHGIFERIDAFSPLKGCDSNQLTEADATDDNVAAVRATFFSALIDRDGNAFKDRCSVGQRPRFLEKTPKNSLRIPLLDKIFPDAQFVYLYRNPRENISSIIDAWRTGGFVTYRNLPGWNGDWSMLLPPGWRTQRGKSLEKIAAFQWRSANEAIIKGLQKIDSDRWMGLSYEQLIKDPVGSIGKMCQFCGINFDAKLEDVCNRRLPLSRYTVSPPSATKWHKNAALLKKVMPGLKGTLKDIQAIFPDIPADEFDTHIDASLTDNSGAAKAVGRNSPCPCGSGKKYKRCHGMMQ